jgi:hypothetical protein
LLLTTSACSFLRLAKPPVKPPKVSKPHSIDFTRDGEVRLDDYAVFEVLFFKHYVYGEGYGSGAEPPSHFLCQGRFPDGRVTGLCKRELVWVMNRGRWVAVPWEYADLNDDGDVDLGDFAEFQREYADEK